MEQAFGYAGIGIEWRGKGVEEKGIVSSISFKAALATDTIKVGDTIIEIDPRYFRPTEVEHLQADITKAKAKLQWQPRTTFGELVKIMVDYDLKQVSLPPIGEGMKVCLQKGFCYTNHEYSYVMMER